MIKIDLQELETNQHHFMTPAAGLNFAHAASVCLESQGHDLTVNLDGEGHYIKSYPITRYVVNDQMKRTWNDEPFTTEQGAYGIAILMASIELDVKAIEKSRKGSGIDYWLGSEDSFLFQNKVRLEVSGIRKGTDQELKQRFEIKMRQSEKSDGTFLPAFVVIVDFNKPRVKTGLRNAYE
ncbi:hypothetical protein ACX0G7_10280 [Flavitalea antarctica]